MSKDTPFSLGDPVLIKSMRRHGVVESLSGSFVSVRVGSMLVRVKASELEEGGDRHEEPEPEGRVTFQTEHRAPSSVVDLHGLRVPDAIERLEQAINLAVLHSLDRLDIVHGLGSGKLIDAVAARLGELGPVSKFQRDDFNPGVTRVYLSVKLPKRR